MGFSQFARLCEVLEQNTPTNNTVHISRAMNNLDKVDLLKLLCMDYPVNNIGNKRAKVWISKAFGIFEDELDTYIKMWGDIGEAVYEIDESNEQDSDYSLRQIISFLNMNCSSINNNAFNTFSEIFSNLSAREKKWFIRYWLRTPRNGVNDNVSKKAVAHHFNKRYSEIKWWSYFNTTPKICEYLMTNNVPPTDLTHGSFVKPMLAKARKGQEKHKKSIIDIKYDGNRYQIHKSWITQTNSTSVLIFNRKGVLVTEKFPDIVDIVSKWDKNFIIDTEIYPVNQDGSPAEHKLMAKRVHKKNVQEAVQECPVKLAVFDILSSDGVSLLHRNLSDRIEVLNTVIPEKYQAMIFQDTSIEAAYNIAINEGFEGIMIKDANARYEPSKRSKAWLKYKPPRVSLDVTITSAKYGEGKRANVFGTFGISVKDGSDYVNVGSVGTGFSDSDLSYLTSELRKIIESYDAKSETYSFLPRIVIEVSCDFITNDSEGNIGLRFPRCMKLRPDKSASESDTLDTVKEMM